MLFNVTYAIVTPESAEHGDCDDQGFVAQGVPLREAIDLIGNTATECDTSPVSRDDPPRWISNYEYGHGTREYFEDGIEETRALHIPDNVTPSSAVRIARLLGAYGVR